MESYSRDTQELIYWLFSDFANFWNGNEVGTTPSEHQLYTAKKTLKSDYLKALGIKLPKEPLEDFLKLLEDKDNISIEELQKAFIKALKMFLLKNNDFSLALNMMSQKNANKLVKYLFEKAFDNDVPLRKQIIELYSEQQQRNYIFKCLLTKKCVICGNYADLDHWDNVSQIGGYPNDDGRQLRYLPLCREHHTEKHGMGRTEFKKKYHIEGIYLKNDKEIAQMKKIYKNHFKAFKEER